MTDRTEFAQWYADTYGADPVQAPRFGPRRDPNYRTEGKKIGVVQRALGKPPMPHQQYIADVATEYDHRGYRYTDVVVVLPRRAGKTTIVSGVQLYKCMKYPRTNVFYTAQTGKDARKRFKDFLELWTTSPLAEFGKQRLAAGQESLEVLPTNSSVDVFAPTPTALHGDEGIMAGVDEFWSLTREAGEALEGNITATQTTLAPWTQTWWFSTVGTQLSEFMNAKMDAGRAGVNPRTCYIECSLEESLDPDDEANWSWHPALGHTITLDTLRDSHTRVSAAEWKRAYMNQRPSQLELPIIPDWDTLDTDQQPPAPGTLALGYEVGTEGTYSSIVAAWHDADDQPHIRVLRQAPGSWWLPEAIVQLADRLGVPEHMIAADDGGPVRRITDELVTAGRLDPVTLNIAERSIADLTLLAKARDDRTLIHDGSTVLANAVSLARLRTTNGVQTISRDKSAGPVPALIAGSVALHRAAHPQAVSVGVF